jgi:hypothetical protein
MMAQLPVRMEYLIELARSDGYRAAIETTCPGTATAAMFRDTKRSYSRA